MCVWMDKENKGNGELLAKWFFLKPQNVLESIQNTNVDLSAFITLLVHEFVMQGRRVFHYI